MPLHHYLFLPLWFYIFFCSSFLLVASALPKQAMPLQINTFPVPPPPPQPSVCHRFYSHKNWHDTWWQRQVLGLPHICLPLSALSSARTCGPTRAGLQSKESSSAEAEVMGSGGRPVNEISAYPPVKPGKPGLLRYSHPTNSARRHQGDITWDAPPAAVNLNCDLWIQPASFSSPGELRGEHDRHPEADGRLSLRSSDQHLWQDKERRGGECSSSVCQERRFKSRGQKKFRIIRAVLFFYIKF